MRNTLIEKDIEINGETFFDYNTQEVSGKDLFDKNHTGMSFYDDFINNLSYMQKNKNLTAKIVELTPKEYFEGCADIFGTSYQHQIDQIKADKDIIEKLKRVILVAKRRFPTTFLDYAKQTQEGRHRMYVAAELTSWDTKFPVMIIDYYNKDLQKEIENKRQQDIKDKFVREAVRNALQYTFRNTDEFETELEYTLSQVFDKDTNPDKVEYSGNTITVYCDGGEYSFPKNELKLDPNRNIDIDDTFDDIDIDDLDNIDDWLKKYL